VNIIYRLCLLLWYPCDINLSSRASGPYTILFQCIFVRAPTQCTVRVINPAPSRVFSYSVVCRFGGSSAAGGQQINEWQSYSNFFDSRLAGSAYSMWYLITPKVQSSHLFTHPCTYIYVTCSRAIIAGYKVNVTGIVRIIYIYIYTCACVRAIVTW